VLCNKAVVFLGLPLTYRAMLMSVIVVLTDVSPRVRSVSPNPEFLHALGNNLCLRKTFQEATMSRKSIHNRCAEYFQRFGHGEYQGDP
jgi:hypothetical protein